MTDLGFNAPFLITYGVLAFIWVIPLLAVWSISFFLVRRKRDPARVGCSWLKAIYPFWLLSSLLYTAQAALAVWYEQDVYYGEIPCCGSGIVTNLGQWRYQVGEVGLFLARIADIALLVTLVELASGFLICLGDKPKLSHRRLRYITLALAFVLFILSIVVFALRTSLHAVYYDAKRASKPRNDEITWYTPALDNQELYYKDIAHQHLDRALRFLIWIAGLPVLIYVSIVTHKTRVDPILRKFISLLLACSILDWIRLVAVAFEQPEFELAWTPWRGIPTLFVVFFNYVFMFIILIILFCLCFRKRNGLWSTPQSWDTPVKTGDVNVTTTNAPEMSSPNYPPVLQQQQQQQQRQGHQQGEADEPPHYSQPQQQLQQQSQPEYDQEPPLYSPASQNEYHNQPQQPASREQPPSKQEQQQQQQQQLLHPLLRQLEIPTTMNPGTSSSSFDPLISSSSSSLNTPTATTRSPNHYQARSPLQPTRLEIDEQKVLIPRDQKFIKLAPGPTPAPAPAPAHAPKPEPAPAPAATSSSSA